MRSSTETIQVVQSTFKRDGDRYIREGETRKEELRPDAITVIPLAADSKGFLARVHIKPGANGRTFDWAVLGDIQVFDNQVEIEERVGTGDIYVLFDNPTSGERLSVLGGGVKI